jgi:hypothetical protein
MSRDRKNEVPKIRTKKIPQNEGFITKYKFEIYLRM